MSLPGLGVPSEQELQDGIVDAARVFRWSVAHFRPARTEKGWRTPGQYDAQGWPDLVLVRASSPIIACEVKGKRTPTTPEQIAWLERFAESGHACAWLVRAGTDDLTTIAGWLARPDDAPRIHLP